MINDNVKAIADAAIKGDYVQTEKLFSQEMSSRVNEYLDAAKEEVAKSFFSEEKMTPKEKGKSEIIIHGMKKNKDEFKNLYGKNYKNVMYATANKMAKNLVEDASEEMLNKIASGIALLAQDGKMSQEDKENMTQVGNAIKAGDIGSAMKHIEPLTTEAKESLKPHIESKYHLSMGL